MSELYDVVKKVVDAPSMEEAGDILYGRESFLNNNEYYREIISNFIKKKELIIRKENNKLLFNLKNINDIWNVVFLGEYIKENDCLRKDYESAKRTMLDELKKLYNEYSNCAAEHTLPGADHANINNKLAVKKKEIFEWLQKNVNYTGTMNRLPSFGDFRNLENLATRCFDANYKNVIDTFYKIDWVKLENSNDEIEKMEATKILKQSINIVHKLRNNIGHGIAKEGSIIDIDSEDFKLSIPVDYLDGFNKGRIVANDEDKIIIERVNSIALPIINKLGSDIRQADSVFYNVSPDWLEYILEKTDYNYVRLSEFSNVLSNEAAGREFLKRGLDLKTINRIRCLSWCNNKPDYIDKVIELIDTGVEPNNIFNTTIDHFDFSMELCKLGIDFNNLNNEALVYEEETRKLLNTGIKIEGLMDGAFYHPEGVIFLKDKGFDITKFDYAFSDYQEAWDLYQKTGYCEDLMFDAYHNIDATTELLDKRIKIDDLNFDAFNFPSETIKLLDNGINIYALEEDEFEEADNIIRLNNALKSELEKKGITIMDINHHAFNYVDNVIKLYKAGIDITSPNISYAFSHPEEAIELFKHGIDIAEIDRKGKYYAYTDPKKTIEICSLINLSELEDYNSYHLFEYPETTIRLAKMGIDVVNLANYNSSYKDSLEGKILLLNELGIDVANLCILNVNTSKIIETFKKCKLYDIDMNKLPYKIYNNMFYNHPDNCVINFENLKYILYLCNNDYKKLEQLPIEFFSCDISLVDEMFKTYNANVSKTIFGLNNPKLIAMLVYCNSVFRKYQKQNGDADKVNFDSLDFIDSSLLDTVKYHNSFEFDSESYINQFWFNEDGRPVNLKSNLLDKLRNSNLHYRFKIVKDDDGNVVKDKVYLYDKRGNSTNNNFNAIVDIEYLLKITHEIEEDLYKKYSEENKSRSR